MILLEITFDGTNFFGWNHSSEKRTILSVLTDALRKVTSLDPILMPCTKLIKNCHAIQFFVNWESQIEIPENFLYKINRCLPEDIAIRNVFCSENQKLQPIFFHYEYHIHFVKQPFLEQKSYYLPHKTDAISKNSIDIEIDYIKTDYRLIIKVKNKKLCSEQALDYISKLVNCPLPAFGLYLTHVEYFGFETQKLNSDHFFIPEPNWFYSK